MPIEELYKIYLKSKKICSNAAEVEPGDLFVALKLHRPPNGFRRWVWEMWRLLELYAPFLIRWIPVMAKRTRFAVQAQRAAHFQLDGNAYVTEAFKNGAGYALVDNPRCVINENCILVPDVLKTIQELAVIHRQGLNIPIIAITGSNGKTTTKDLVTSVLATTYSTFATTGSANDYHSIPLTILNIPDAVEMVVLEMGAISRNNITALCQIAQPTHGLITSIGKAHLGTFHSIEGVQRGKGELFDFLISHDGMIFKNLNDKRVAELAVDADHVVTYGSHEAAHIRGDIFAEDPFITVCLYEPESNEVSCRKFSNEKQAMFDTVYSSNRPKCDFLKFENFLPITETTVEIKTQFVGRYNLDNVLAAVTVGRCFQVKMTDIKMAIESSEPTRFRSQIIPYHSNTIIFDAYNANPTSMRAALSSFDQLEAKHKIVVLGGMLGLGSVSSDEHRALLALVKSMSLDEVIFIGQEFLNVRNDEVGHYFITTQEAKTWMLNQQIKDTTILMKGSRGNMLESLLTDLELETH